MSTTQVTSWAVDLSTLGPIYPFVGWEFPLFIAGLVFWIGFHIWQIGSENRTYSEDMEFLTTPEAVEEAIRKRTLD